MGVDLNNIVNPQERKQAKQDLGLIEPMSTRKEDIQLSDTEDDEKAEILGEQPNYANQQPIRRSRRKRNLKAEEIHPIHKPTIPKKSKPETDSDFEQEENRLNKLINKYYMQGKFHLANKTEDRKKQLLKAKKKKLGRKNNQSTINKFKLPRLNIRNRDEFKPPSISSDSSSDDIPPPKHRYNLRPRKRKK